MFDKFATDVTSSTPTPSNKEMPKTIAFLTLVRDQGYRLNYGALAKAAQHLGEDSSGQILGQRGSWLCKQLPTDLQPYVCQKKGGYNKAVKWEGVDVPADLKKRPVITEEGVVDAIKVAAKAAKAAKKAAKDEDAGN